MPVKFHVLNSQRGVGLVEALVVTVIVAMAGLAFLTLVENQNIFVKRTRQTNARDQLTFFFTGPDPRSFASDVQRTTSCEYVTQKLLG